MSGKYKYDKRLWSGETFNVSVRLLEDDKVSEFAVPVEACGKWLFDEVCRQQDIMEEREYFGLRYLEHDILSSPSKHWLDLSRNAQKQLKHTHPCVVSFRVKHYPAEPLVDLKLPKTLYLVYHQLKRDIASGRLIANSDEMVRLGALVTQVELGDKSVQDPPQISTKSNEERHYLTDFRVLHHQPPRIAELLMQTHTTLEGLLPFEAAIELIRLASSLDTYGVDPVRVKTKSHGSRPIHIGLTHRGVAEYVSRRCQKLYPWSDISWMTCDGKHFVIARKKRLTAKKKLIMETISFKCESKAIARGLWEWAIDRQLFLTLDKSTSVKTVKSKSGLFSRSRTFTFSGRCRREVMGRPTLAATLPADFSKTRTEPNEEIPQCDCPSHSFSMVALGNEPNISEPINEEQIKLPEALIDGHEKSLYTNSCQSNLSEPVAQQGARSYVSSDEVAALESSSAMEPVEIVKHFEPVQLTFCFDSTSKRRLAPQAQVKQKRMIRNYHRRHQSLDERNMDAFDTDEEDDDFSTDAAIAELHAVTEAGKEWVAAELSEAQLENDKKEESNCQSIWSSLLPDYFRRKSNTLEESQRNGTTVSSIETIDSDGNTDIYSSIDSEQPQHRSIWKMMAISAGVLTCSSLFSLALIFETGWYNPLLNTLPEHSYIFDFYTRIYHPFRSALTGFWRR